MHEYIKSHKNNDQIFLDGFTYEYNGKRRDTTYYRCILYGRGCRGTCNEKEGIVTKRKEHCHDEDFDEKDRKEFYKGLKIAASTSELSTPKRVVASYISDKDNELLQKISDINPLKKMAQRVLHKIEDNPPAPRNIDDIAITGTYTVTGKNESFLLSDTGVGTDRLLIFSTIRNMKLLANSKDIHADGTFKSSPQHFEQMFSIHSIVNGNLLPLVYVISFKKSSNIYDRVLDIILEKEPLFMPNTLMMDFDRAQLKSFLDRFPSIKLRGCYFHWKKCILKNMKDSKELYSKFLINQDLFKSNLKKLFALCFLPEIDIIRGFELLMAISFFTSLDNHLIINQFLMYFEKVWIGTKIGNSDQRNNPIYTPAIWSQNYAVLSDLDRTNNKVEGFHNGFKSMMSCDNPTIWTFINNLKLEQALTEFKVLNGFELYPTTLTRDQKRYNAKIKSIVSSYNNQDILEFLTSLSPII